VTIPPDRCVWCSVCWQERVGEVEGLKEEVAGLKLENHQQQTTLAQLRSALKSSLHHHKVSTLVVMLCWII